jgi:GNAT superfamily N-acetyltransferase
MHAVSLETDNYREVAAELDSRLARFNETAAGPLQTRYLALTVRDESGALVAGLTGEAFWGALHVDLLWVDQAYRGLGYGRSLLQRAEHVAAENSCRLVYLSTFDFQAPAFYAKHGYRRIGELPDVPQGSRRLWFSKTLPVTSESMV